MWRNACCLPSALVMKRFFLFERMGHAIAKVAKEAWHGVEHVGEEAWHGVKKGAEDVGHAVEKGAEDVYHGAKDVVDDVGAGLKEAAHIATTVVVDVGGVAEHVVSLIPGGIGTTLSNGIAGVVDLAQKGEKGIDDAVDIVKDPIHAIEEAKEIITHPSELRDKLEDVANLVKGVASDVTKVVLAAAAVTPEGAEIAPELLTLANVGTKVQQAAQTGEDLLSGNVSAALNDGMGFLPKSAQQLAKAVNASVKVATALKDGNYSAALNAAKPFLPAKIQKGVAAYKKAIKTKVANKAIAMAKKVTKHVPRGPRSIIEKSFHTYGTMETRSNKPQVHMLVLPPGAPLTELHRYFRSRHPTDELSYIVFLPDEITGEPRFHMLFTE